VTQLVPIPKDVISVPEREDSKATHELVFQAANLPPLGFRSYYVTKFSNSSTEVTPSDDLFIGDAVSTVLVMMWA
jgi:lysosomal alpha-mannosidase